MTEDEKTPMTKVREAVGLSINELARRIDVPYPTVRIIDRGQGRGYNPMTKLKIAQALGVDVLAIFPEVAEMIDFISGIGYVVTKEKRATHGKSKAKKSR